ncbi:uncharacterized protein ACNLHF_004581, partial [Anomaloglossus baeobatrachus]
WILGHSYVYWGARRADARWNGRQLDRPPDILVLHAGGNDLGGRPFRILIKDIKHD